MTEEKCQSCRYNSGVLEKIKNEMPSADVVERLADVFKVFGDPTRIKILWALFDHEICVFDLAEKIGMSQSAISHQLRVLKQARLVRSRRDGKNTFYALDDDHVKRIIEQVMIHIDE